LILILKSEAFFAEDLFHQINMGGEEVEADRIHAIAKNIVNTTFDKLPSNVVEVTKKLLLDTLAVSLCGSTEAGVHELAEMFMDWGGREESTIWGYGGKIPCINAAQVNATMVHASDYDDTHDPSPVHTGVVAVPVAFALAERIGGIDGKKLITALALGVEVTVRLCKACKTPMPASGWHYTALHGNFNAAAVAGKLLEFDEERLVHTFGLAYHQAGGNLQCIPDGALAKRMGPGFAARNGIMAALMAQKGITGAKSTLEGPHGLFTVYHRGEYDPEALTENLGERYHVVDLSFKPYPCCRLTHPSIDATLALVKDHKIKAEDIEVVAISVGKYAMEDLCEPLDIKRNPRTIVDAQFSIPWVVAVAIAQGKVGLGAFTGEAIKDRGILLLSNRVVPKIDEFLGERGLTPVVVQIETKGGHVYSKRVDNPSGSPQNPMSTETALEKFRDCASHAIRPVTEDPLEKLIQLISRLESVTDVNRIVRLMEWSQ
jgi:2-methylcitrate dehydratase PrpD